MNDLRVLETLLGMFRYGWRLSALEGHPLLPLLLPHLGITITITQTAVFATLLDICTVDNFSRVEYRVFLSVLQEKFLLLEAWKSADLIIQASVMNTTSCAGCAYNHNVFMTLRFYSVFTVNGTTGNRCGHAGSSIPSWDYFMANLDLDGLRQTWW